MAESVILSNPVLWMGYIVVFLLFAVECKTHCSKGIFAVISTLGTVLLTVYAVLLNARGSEVIIVLALFSALALTSFYGKGGKA